MKISPIDIAHKNFSRKVMGLDAAEVTEFLRDVAEQMEELNREKNALKESLRQKELNILEFREREDTLKATISTATKMAEQIRLDAEREANLVIGEAQQKAEMIVRDGREQIKRIYQEISDFKRVRMQFESNLRALCQAHVSMLDQSHISMPDPKIDLAMAAQVTAPAGSGKNMNPNMNPGMNTSGAPAPIATAISNSIQKSLGQKF